MQTQLNNSIDVKLVKMKEVQKMFSCSRPMVYTLIKKFDFPKPIKLTNTAIAFHYPEIKIWLDNRTRVNNKSMKKQ